MINLAPKNGLFLFDRATESAYFATGMMTTSMGGIWHLILLPQSNFEVFVCL